MPEIMTYKGYQGSVRYNEVDKEFYGKVSVCHRSPLRMYTGLTKEELKKAFESIVDKSIEVGILKEGNHECT